MKKIAIIFAGGVGQRFGSEIPKQFVNIYGSNIIIHTLNVFQKHEEIDEIYIGCVKEWIPYLTEITTSNGITKIPEDGIIPGGNSGQDTIYRILKKAREYNEDEDIVLIHDGVRPIVTKEEISNNIKSVEEYGSAITCIPFTETPIYSEKGEIIDKTFDRKTIYRGVAPQSFRLGHIIEAHEKIRINDSNYEGIYNGSSIVDSASLMTAAFNEKCHIVKGNPNNMKVTTTGDYFALLGILQSNDIENYFYGKTNNEILLNPAMEEAKNIKKRKMVLNNTESKSDNNDNK